MVQVLQQTDCSLGGFDWLDTKPRLRRWFADWLTGAWEHIYAEALHEIQTKEEWAGYDAMEDFIKTFAVTTSHLPTSKQLAALDAKARNFNFKTTRERVENVLRYFLTTAGQQKKHSTAFKASPWCDHFATTAHILEQAGKNIPYQLYPTDPDARLALDAIILELGSFEIHREVSPAMSQLFAMQRGLNQLNEAVKTLPSDSPMMSAFKKIEGLRDYAAEVDAELTRRANEPSAFLTPVRVRRLQRRAYYAVRRLCKPKDGPEKLARFVKHLLKNWPRVPAGITFDLKEHFNADNRRKLVRDHLGLAQDELNKEGRALWHVLNAMVFRDELRGHLLNLACKADQKAQKRRKGWSHLCKVLRAVFNHIGREVSDEELFRDFERTNFAAMRDVTWEKRLRLFPSLRGEADRSRRDLTKKERMELFKRFKKRSRTHLDRDADGRNSFATRYGRAMKSVRDELGQE